MKNSKTGRSRIKPSEIRQAQRFAEGAEQVDELRVIDRYRRGIDHMFTAGMADALDRYAEVLAQGATS